MASIRCLKNSNRVGYPYRWLAMIPVCSSSLQRPVGFYRRKPGQVVCASDHAESDQPVGRETGRTTAAAAQGSISLAPAVWFAYSSDRKGIHPLTHLASFSGVLQADAYIGRIAAVFDVLAIHDIGTHRAEQGENICSLPAEQHMIFFMSSHSVVTIIRILSQYQDTAWHMLCFCAAARRGGSGRSGTARSRNLRN